MIHFFSLIVGDSTAGNDLMNASQISQKRIKVQPAMIANDESDEEGSEIVHEKPLKKEPPETFEIDEMGKREHLETKKQIEQLRKEYGDSWLHSKGASEVQGIMGIQTSPQKPLQKSPQTTEQMLEKLFGMGTSQEPQRTSTPIQNDSLADELAHSPSDVS